MIGSEGLTKVIGLVTNGILLLLSLILVGMGGYGYASMDCPQTSPDCEPTSPVLMQTTQGAGTTIPMALYNCTSMEDWDKCAGLHGQCAACEDACYVYWSRLSNALGTSTKLGSPLTSFLLCFAPVSVY